jgi:hypothetical protein
LSNLVTIPDFAGDGATIGLMSEDADVDAPVEGEPDDRASEPVGDALEPAWQAVLAAWDDPAAHKRFLTLCASTDRFADAGRRYREIRDTEPERADVARAQIDKLLAMAMQNLEALKTEPRARNAKSTMTLIALGVSGALVITALWSMLRAM